MYGRRSIRQWFLASALALGVGALPVGYAGVVTNTNDSGPGSLRQCIADAQPGEEIRFDPGLDGQPIVLNTPIQISKDLTVNGNGRENTTLVGNRNGNQEVLVVHFRTVVVSGVTIRDGAVGILNYGTLTVNDCAILNNSRSRPLGFGGGIRSTGTLTINNSTVADNAAEIGGGIANPGGTLTITNSTIENNSAMGVPWSSGGGIYSRGTLTVDSSTITGNSATFHGGGIYCEGSIANTFTNSTILGNSAQIGGGISSFENMSVTFRNSIVANQIRGRDCWYNYVSPISSLGHNLESSYHCRFTRPSDLRYTDPMLKPLQDNGGPTRTHLPMMGSPVIDGGMCDAGTDQRGVPRPLDGNRDNVWLCDMGAVEFNPYEFEVVGPGGDVIVIPSDAE